MTTDKRRGDGLNLTTHRASASVWERRGWNGTRARLTVTRWLVGIVGTALAVQGVRKRKGIGGLLAGLGAGLACWALAGEDDLFQARRWSGRVLEPWFRRDDLVQQASTESFPASDAPSWTSTVGTGVRRRA
jgi:hypothetical protein